MSARALLGVLALVAVASVAAVATIVATRSTGDGLGDRISSLRDDAVPASHESKDREAVQSLAREFSVRFNTYDPEMLGSDGNLPEYAEVTDLMTSKFEAVFTADTDANNWTGLEVVEQVVQQVGASSTADVHAVGVAAIDGDSAEVVVGGTLEVSRPVTPEGDGQGGGQGGDPQQVSSGPRQFRYQLSLVKTEGEWRVDDLDDVDDGLPSLVDAAEAPPTDQPTNEGSPR
jgi:hypothetical protein